MPILGDPLVASPVTVAGLAYPRVKVEDLGNWDLEPESTWTNRVLGDGWA